MRVNQIMTENPICAQDDMPIHTLFSLFKQHNIHHLPIINTHDELVGIISDRDVSKHTSPFVNTPKERVQDKKTLSIL